MLEQFLDRRGEQREVDGLREVPDGARMHRVLCPKIFLRRSGFWFA